MRNFTRITSALTPEASVELLNAYFDCLVPPIEAESGEVLKYMGDGLLAIFRELGDDLGGAAQSALSAAGAALTRIEAANLESRFPVPIDVGIALHHGEAAYGNVGSGERLDFTVIGRDVNLASRIAQLNKQLGEPLLMSQAFVDFLWGDPESLGEHDINGFEEPIAVFRPR
jgi:adenylate cyclase